MFGTPVIPLYEEEVRRGARQLIVDGTSYPMAGVLDLVVEHGKRPDGHGYVEAEVDRSNPYFALGTRLRGHEFHYSRVTGGEDSTATTLRLRRGRGVGGARDGVVRGRIWASYTHLHALGTPSWGTSFAAAAAAYRRERAGDGNGNGFGQGGQGIAATGA